MATYKRKTKETLLEVEGYETAFEGKVITDIVRVLPEGATLFASNSMPIRDTDSFSSHRIKHSSDGKPRCKWD